MIFKIFIGIVLFFLVSLIFLAINNRFLPKWFCDHLHWHLEPEINTGFNGCSFTGTCPRCGRDVMMDSNGNWF